MKDMAMHTRVNPAERIGRLTNFANRLLSSKEVITLIIHLVENNIFF